MGSPWQRAWSGLAGRARPASHIGPHDRDKARLADLDERAPWRRLLDAIQDSRTVAERQRASGELIASAHSAGPQEWLALVDALIAAGTGEDAQRSPLALPRHRFWDALSETHAGITVLLGLRETLLADRDRSAARSDLDDELKRHLATLFSQGLLEMRRLGWHSSALILGKLIEYEAVHAIDSWDDLRSRLEPADRRCYAFFHPALPDEPLIFVEVALMDRIPTSIGEVLRHDRPSLSPGKARVAVFYSISNCQKALRGLPFGGHLISSVIDALTAELPALRTAATLSPIPGFSRWLARQPDGSALARLREDLVPGWHDDPERTSRVREPLMRAAARFLLTETGRDADPVARFHTANGARIGQLDWMADPAPKGLAQSFGLMVNYLYDPAHIEPNQRKLHEIGIPASSRRLRHLLGMPFLSGRWTRRLQ
jgi:malonyl-CoA decarboxylase